MKVTNGDLVRKSKVKPVATEIRNCCFNDSKHVIDKMKCFVGNYYLLSK